jgi:hypothetical protein
VYRYATEGDRRIKIVTAAMYAAAAADALYITAIGGDYMHGRLLLPAFFALGLPASVVLRRGALHTLVLVGAGAAWATLSVIAFRPPTPTPLIGIALRPVTDWRTLSGARLVPKDVALGPNGFQAAAEYRNGIRGYFELTDQQARAAKDPGAYVLTLASIGVPAYHAGVHIWIVDIGGLAEPLAARAPPIAGRVAGHRKQTDAAWYDARFGRAVGGAKVIAARHALTCGPLPGLLASLDAPLTPGRFLSNIWHSFDNTFLTVPADPAVAERRWCPHR